MPVASSPNPCHKNYRESKIWGSERKIVHTFKMFIQHWCWIPRSVILDSVAASWKWTKIKKKKILILIWALQGESEKWKMQEGKAGRSDFKKGNLILRVQFLPAKFAHAFLEPEAIQQVWTCLYFSWQEHNRGKPAVRVLRYANKFFWQMPVSQLAATHEKAEAEPQPCCYTDVGWAQLFLPVPSLCVRGV